MLQYAKHKVAHLYRSLATVFPDGIKMQLIPPINTIISQASKEKYGLVVARQETFIAKLGVELGIHPKPSVRPQRQGKSSYYERSHYGYKILQIQGPLGIPFY
jgi:hypothetical protein